MFNNNDENKYHYKKKWINLYKILIFLSCKKFR